MARLVAILALLLLLVVVLGGGLNIKTRLSQPVTASSSSAAAASSADSVVGRPTISASFIDRVLSACSSPATGRGQALYNQGVEYNIDPAWPLGFFVRESTCGTKGMATLTRSLGNLRCTASYACVNQEGRACQPGQSCYAAFSTWEDGFEAWYKLIRYYYINQRHLTTLEQIIPVYAPNSDGNNEQSYIQAVKSAVAAWRSGQVVV